MLNRSQGGTYVGRYDSATIWLHWVVVGLIVALWVIGQTAGLLPRGPFRSSLWFVHIVLGYITGVVLLMRVTWRALFGRILTPANAGLRHALAKATHYALYALPGAVVVLGIMNAFYRGFSLFGIWSAPPVGTIDTATLDAISEWHELAANLTILIACLHAGAALIHHYVWRDRLLNRMKL